MDAEQWKAHAEELEAKAAANQAAWDKKQDVIEGQMKEIQVSLQCMNRIIFLMFTMHPGCTSCEPHQRPLLNNVLHVCRLTHSPADSHTQPSPRVADVTLTCAH